MASGIDLSDPDFEPTDAQLSGLMARAFAGVPEANRAALASIHEKIRLARAETLRNLDARLSAPRRAP
jgi:hypothetical protein